MVVKHSIKNQIDQDNRIEEVEQTVKEDEDGSVHSDSTESDEDYAIVEIPEDAAAMHVPESVNVGDVETHQLGPQPIEIDDEPQPFEIR